jgi:hypothetical protein
VNVVTSFLAELGKRLAERWLTLLVLPGLLYLGAVATVAVLGGLHWATADRLLAGVPPPVADQPVVTVAVAAVALLLASAAVGLAAQTVGALVDHVWTSAWPKPFVVLVAPLTQWRRRRWRQAHRRFIAATDERRRDKLAAERNRIGLSLPEYPTWIGDRLAAMDGRIWNEYGLDLTSCWPRLWLVLPDSTRIAVDTARGALLASTVLAGWAALYLLLGILWWPAVLVGVVVGVTSWRRARSAAAALGDLIESAVDVHGPALATALGFPLPDNRISPSIGKQISERCRKGT